MDCFFSFQVTYSVPYALVSSRIESLGLGQGGFRSLSLYSPFDLAQQIYKYIYSLLVSGLSMGVLNVAIVIPQVSFSILSLVSAFSKHHL